MAVRENSLNYTWRIRRGTDGLRKVFICAQCDRNNCSIIIQVAKEIVRKYLWNTDENLITCFKSHRKPCNLCKKNGRSREIMLQSGLKPLKLCKETKSWSIKTLWTKRKGKNTRWRRGGRHCPQDNNEKTSLVVRQKWVIKNFHERQDKWDKGQGCQGFPLKM